MRLIKFTTALVFALVLAGCSRVQPIMNIENSPVAFELSQTEVKQAIVKAAQARGWIIKDVNDSELAAEIFVRSHHAEIKIPYTSKYYSIIYSGSLNLMHEGDNIHRNYNKWITLLNNNIQQELGVISATK